ncbi:carbohydrate ABC transporter permease [Evansella tamaricis]|uniref:Sugar ABC transporter permease n=1 Tax=Evansella tamaricis TaxID=2069301 RepID=A0ABS6JCU3_9BACI|nr:sugar ABC transporter permease [Evansella tamaricis]MBU9710677.1 sugar ABC transporter permease [Evansella tamaricis]
MKKRLRTKLHTWFFLLPSLVFLILFTFYPMIQTLIQSFTHTFRGETFFVGMENYLMLKDDKVFWKVMGNTVTFVLAVVPISMALALSMALFLNRKFIGSGIMRAVFFYPAIIPSVAIANIWLFVYTPNFGLLSQFLSLFGISSLNILGNTETVLWGTIVMAIWKEAGFYMIFYLAGLQNLSKEIYESTKLDGANSWQSFSRITFPLLMPTTLFVLILATTNAFKLVDHLVVMTGGGPNNASNLLLFYIYQTAFSYWNDSKAAVLTIIFLVILLSIAVFQLVVLERKIHYR